MINDSDLIIKIHESASKRIIFLPHAIRQMSRTERMISASEVRNIIIKGKIIEDYPNDARGHSALLAGKSDSGRFIHVVCSPKIDYLAIITAYLPDSNIWTKNFTMRKK